MSATSLGYRAAAMLGAALAPGLGLLNAKIRTGHRARLGSVGRLRRWADASRDPERPLVWFHASSVGEGLQAESVLEELRRLQPDCQYVYTHFSPSAEPLARRLAVDTADYLPYDRPAAAEDLLGALSPTLLVFAKLDLWPELATRAAERGTRVAIVAGTVSRGSGRLRWPARSLLRPGYATVTAAGVISQEDGDRLATLGVPAEHIRVLGDPRFDSAARRVQAVAVDDPLFRFGAGAPTLVAGSTWRRDEAVLLDGFARVRIRHPDARLILVPHEPTAGHLRAVERAAGLQGLPSPVRLSVADSPVPLLLVDRVGVLAALYGVGSMAYVGGGFGGAGLHSVLEPAAWRLPVVFGPRWSNSRDAELLLNAGAAEALPESGPSEAGKVLCTQWETWIGDPARRETQGRRAGEVVDRGRGASRRSAEMLAELISSPLPRRLPTAAR
jgi:3-deoxy-D-manno-octulosonic-acid transferase